MNRKSVSMKMRHALLKAGVTKQQVAVALAVLSPKGLVKLRLTAQVRSRISSLLVSPGDRCILVRNHKGVRVFSPEGLETAQASAKKHKPHLHSPSGKKSLTSA